MAEVFQVVSCSSLNFLSTVANLSIKGQVHLPCYPKTHSGLIQMMQVLYTDSTYEG